MKQHIDELALAAMYQAHNYQELARMARDHFSALGFSRMVLVSWPISTGGLWDRLANVLLLDAACSYLSEQWHTVFPSLAFEPVTDRLYEKLQIQWYPYELISDFFGGLITHGYIETLYMLPDRQSSTGAQMEHDIAIQTQIPIDENILADYKFLPPHLLYQFQQYR